MGGSFSLNAYFVSLSFDTSTALLTLQPISGWSLQHNHFVSLTNSAFFISDLPLSHLHVAAQARVYRKIQPSPAPVAHTSSQVNFLLFVPNIDYY